MCEVSCPRHSQRARAYGAEYTRAPARWGSKPSASPPPLTIDREIADRIVDILAESIADMEAEMLPAERDLWTEVV